MSRQQLSSFGMLWAFICTPFTATIRILDWHKKWGILCAAAAAGPVGWFYL